MKVKVKIDMNNQHIIIVKTLKKIILIRNYSDLLKIKIKSLKINQIKIMKKKQMLNNILKISTKLINNF